MKRGMLAFGVLALTFAVTLGAEALAAAEVRLAPVRQSYAPPPLRHKQGWLSITNRDWQDYTFVENRKGRASLYPGNTYGGGGIVIPSGVTVVVALEKDGWELMGNNPDRLKVKVREGRTSTLTLEPFGSVGGTGLIGITNDGDRVRREVLFENYSRPVVVQPPTVVVNRPPPPPVIINRPPVIVERPHYRPPYRPPHRPPYRPHRRDGWGFTFGYESR